MDKESRWQPRGVRGSSTGAPMLQSCCSGPPTLGPKTWVRCKSPIAGLIPAAAIWSPGSHSSFCTPSKGPHRARLEARLRLRPEQRCLFLAVATGRCTDSVHSRTLCTHSRTHSHAASQIPPGPGSDQSKVVGFFFKFFFFFLIAVIFLSLSGFHNADRRWSLQLAELGCRRERSLGTDGARTHHSQGLCPTVPGAGAGGGPG